jgi:hypothetical protein
VRTLLARLSRATSGRRLACAYLALGALYMLPPWLVRYQPTNDGGSHVYNAWVLRGLVTGTAPPGVVEHFEVNRRPLPNWLGHALMALLMGVAAPAVAEKLLASGYVAVLLGGMWKLAQTVEPGERWPALLAFPFVYHLLFQRGFYNFSLGLALVLWVLACWWRHRRRLTGWHALLLNLLLLACWFAHPLPYALALLGIALFWATTLPGVGWRQRLWQVAVLSPQLALPIWYLTRASTAGPGGSWEWQRLFSFFGRLDLLVAFDGGQRWPALALALVFATLLVRTLWVRGAPGAPRRDLDAYLLLATIAFATYLFAPATMAGGSMVKQRLGLAPWLLVIPGLATQLGSRARRVATGALVALGLLHLGVVAHWYRQQGGEVATYVAGLATVPSGAGLVPLHFERRRPTYPLSHAAGYAAAAQGLVYLDNYEAKRNYFPVRYRRTAKIPRMGLASRLASRYQVAPNRALVDAIYTWKMPAEEPLRRELRTWYRRAARSGGGELWLRRDGPATVAGRARAEGR